MGRHSKRTPAIVETILAGLRLGIPLAELCRRPGMPTPETWRNWCRADYDLEEAYAQARAEGYDAILEEVARLLASGPTANTRRIHALSTLAAKWWPEICEWL
ncbi:hypothetical protein FHW96_001857 [Novosphingobium sp. SG751A]|uniref:terminase small subunit-like protein n=1 Tax=Novosphingobium sp. SG751A TaxID=2587000 RepID=UPI0035304F42|nr:hypothetical protein [Novosphingobium sp. SG751A]